MSSLIYYADVKQALVVTDTLATLNGKPAFFTSKATYVPHLRMIVAGTGVAGFAAEWADYSGNWMLVHGIEHLDYFASDYLQKAWARWKDERSIPEDTTTTVYCFGISERTGNAVIFVYRSADDFISQRIDPEQGNVIGAKPDCTLPSGPDLLQAIKPMMLEQRELQSELPMHERIHIGGEAIAMHLTSEGCRIFSLFRFDDFEDQMQQALNNLG